MLLLMLMLLIVVDDVFVGCLCDADVVMFPLMLSLMLSLMLLLLLQCWHRTHWSILFPEHGY